MSIEKVRAYLKNMNCPKEVIEFEQSSATVELAAQAAGVIPARITKTLCLMSKEGPIVICVAGDTKIDNRKFKDTFGLKAKMLSPEETLEATGHAVGGVCPFALPEGTKAYADISMKRFDTVFPAAGSSNSLRQRLPCRRELLNIHAVCKAGLRVSPGQVSSPSPGASGGRIAAVSSAEDSSADLTTLAVSSPSCAMLRISPTDTPR